MVDKIRKLCKEYGKSISSLERECGFGNGTINKWDKNSPSITKVMAVAKALGVSVSDLINEEAPTSSVEDGQKEVPPTDTSEGAATETAAEFAALVDRLTADQQQLLLAQLRAWTAQNEEQVPAARRSGRGRGP